jgi:hypothetical protein
MTSLPTAGKYANIPTKVDNIVFHSRKEARRYIELRALLRAGHIRNLELQPRYDMVVNGVKIGFYKADFRYTINKNNKTIIEDVKGARTQVYRLKKKIVEALYGIAIYES